MECSLRWKFVKPKVVVKKWLHRVVLLYKIIITPQPSCIFNLAICFDLDFTFLCIAHIPVSLLFLFYSFLQVHCYFINYSSNKQQTASSWIRLNFFETLFSTLWCLLTVILEYLNILQLFMQTSLAYTIGWDWTHS